MKHIFKNYDLKSQLKEQSSNKRGKILVKFADILCCEGTENNFQNQKGILLVSDHVKCFNNQKNTVFRIQYKMLSICDHLKFTELQETFSIGH